MTDRCACCFVPLAPAPLGGRYACATCPPSSGYWSPAVPEAGRLKDVALVSKHGRPTLYYYGAVL